MRVHSIYPQLHWNDLSNQRNVVDKIGKELGLESLEDWYRIKSKDIRKFENGRRVLSRYKDSLSIALPKIYPDHNWQLWRFHQVLGAQ